MEIKVENLVKSYGKEKAIEDLSLTIKSGCVTTLIGPTGAGKTTLLRILSGMESPDNGKVYYDGEDVTELDVRERNVAFVFQDFINYPNLSVFENIASPMRVSGYSEEEIEKKVKKYSSFLSVEGLLDKNIDKLSGGEKQRTAIARSLAKEAEVIFMDEPLINLDYKLRESLREVLKRSFKESGRTVVFATSEPIDTFSISDYVAFLHNGKVEQSGPVQEVYDRPQTLAVASYFGIPPMNILETKLVEGEKPHFEVTEELKISAKNMKEFLPEGKYSLGIRAHYLQPSPEGEGLIKITGKVDASDISGSKTTVRIQSYKKAISAVISEPVYYEIGKEIDMFLDVKNEFYVFDNDTGKLITTFLGEKDSQD